MVKSTLFSERDTYPNFTKILPSTRMHKPITLSARICLAKCAATDYLFFSYQNDLGLQSFANAFSNLL